MEEADPLPAPLVVAIGVSKYHIALEEGIGDSESHLEVEEDIEAILKTAKDLHLDVRAVLNKHKSDIEEELIKAVEDLVPYQTLMVIFSGHAFTSPGRWSVILPMNGKESQVKRDGIWLHEFLLTQIQHQRKEKIALCCLIFACSL